MASDSRYSDGASILTDNTQKILQRQDGITVAGAGHGAPANFMMNSKLLCKTWTDAGPEFPLEWIGEEVGMVSNVGLMIHRTGDKVVYLSSGSRWCDPMPINKEMIGIGSGECFARAACRVLENEHHSPTYTPKTIIRKAVEYAISLDPNSGGDVQLVRLV